MNSHNKDHGTNQLLSPPSRMYLLPDPLSPPETPQQRPHSNGSSMSGNYLENTTEIIEQLKRDKENLMATMMASNKIYAQQLESVINERNELKTKLEVQANKLKLKLKLDDEIEELKTKLLELESKFEAVIKHKEDLQKKLQDVSNEKDAYFAILSAFPAFQVTVSVPDLLVPPVSTADIPNTVNETN